MVQRDRVGDAFDFQPEAPTQMLRKSLFALLIASSMFGCKKTGGDAAPASEAAEKAGTSAVTAEPGAPARGAFGDDKGGGGEVASGAAMGSAMPEAVSSDTPVESRAIACIKSVYCELCCMMPIGSRKSGRSPLKVNRGGSTPTTV